MMISAFGRPSRTRTTSPRARCGAAPRKKAQANTDALAHLLLAHLRAEGVPAEAPAEAPAPAPAKKAAAKKAEKAKPAEDEDEEAN